MDLWAVDCGVTVKGVESLCSGTGELVGHYVEIQLTAVVQGMRFWPSAVQKALSPSHCKA
jgi:hypothetical protein